jgi:hypothetical protein
VTPSGETKRQPGRLYLDTSAYLCLLLAQEGWQQLARETAGARLLSSVLLVMETRRNLVRLVREGQLNAAQYDAAIGRLDQDMSLFLLRDLTLDLCQSNAIPVVATPRTLDLAHLRTALWFHAASPIDRFVTMDTAQQQAAKELGLPI